jgi:hypothetical protein
MSPRNKAEVAETSIMVNMRAVLSVIFLTGLAMATSAAQTPRPFPQPGTAQPQTPPSSQAPAPVRPAAPPATQPAAPPPVTPPPAASAQPVGAPPAETVVYPVHPTAQFIASYDAGRGQRYYLYGSTAPYTELVAFYRTQLKEKGDEVFDQPPTYMFQIGRFRDETMAFRPE